MPIRPGDIWPAGKIDVVVEGSPEQQRAPDGQRIVVPTKEMQEEILERCHTGKRCGECKHFRLHQGQHELRDQRLFERLYNELKHDPVWYGQTNLFGLCDAFGMEHMCATLTPAVVPAHLLDSSLSNAVERDPIDGKLYAAVAKDERRECPCWERGGSTPGTDPASSYVGKRRNYED